MTKQDPFVLIFVDYSLSTNDDCIQYFKELIKDAGIKNFKFITPYHSVRVSDEDIKNATKKCENTIKKYKPSVVVIAGNNLLASFEFVKKAQGITKFRGKVFEDTRFGCPIIPIESPALSHRDRSREIFLACDLKTAYKVSTGKFERQVPMKIYDITKPEHVYQLIKEAEKTGLCAYDFETSGLDKFGEDIVGTGSFCPKKDSKGVYHVWHYAEYKMLKPQFSKEELEELKKAFKELFNNENISRIAWNASFDDPFSEIWLGESLPLSSYDAMYMEWCLKTKRPHGLKESTNLYLGYPEYDQAFEEIKEEVKKRRGRVLTEQVDLDVLEFFGIKPDTTYKKTPKYEMVEKTVKKTGEIKKVKTKVGTEETPIYKWPSNVDKLKAAYLVVDPDVVREYNSLDAAYTLALFLHFMPIIEEKELIDSCELRHRIGEVFIRGEQAGFPLDVKLNRKWNKQLGTYIEQTTKAIQTLVAPYLPDDFSPEDFNPNSQDQVNQVLYGEVGNIPSIDRLKFLQHFRDEDFLKIVDQVEENLFSEVDEIKELLRNDEFDYISAQDALISDLSEAIFYGDHDLELPYWITENYVFPVRPRPLGLGGMLCDPVALTQTGKPSLSKTSLLSLKKKYEIADEDGEEKPPETDPQKLIDLVLMQKKCVKYKSTFIEKVYESLDPVKKVVRASHNPVGTATGRASASKSGKKGFNPQQMPSGFKSQILAPKGYKIFSLDISQAEVYTLAAFSNDQLLIQALSEQDLHKFVASRIFKCPVEEITKTKRAQGKTTLFLTVYGGGAAKLASAFGIKKSEAQAIIDDFRSAFPDMTAWLENQTKLAHQEPYEVKTAFGTRISTRDVLSSDYMTVLHGERIAGNAPIQGSAGEAMLYKIANINDRLIEENWNAWWIASVHDSASWIVGEELIDEVIPIYDDAGEVSKYNVTGEFFEKLIKPEFDTPVPYPPLDTVKFKIDCECFDRWGSDNTDLTKFLSSKKPGDIFRYDLIGDGNYDEDYEYTEII